MSLTPELFICIDSAFSVFSLYMYVDDVTLCLVLLMI